MADGRLMFDTALDTTGFDKGSEKLKQAIQGLIGRVGDAGNQIKDSLQDSLSNGNYEMSTGTFDKYINDIQSRLATAFSDMSNYTDKLGTVKTPAQMTDLMAKIEDARIRIESLQQELADMGQTVVNTDQFEKLKAECNEAQDALEKLKSERDAALAGAANDFEKVGIIDYYRSDIEKAQENVKRLSDEMGRVAANGGSFIPEDTQSYQQLAAAVQIASNAYTDLAQKAGDAQTRIQAQATADAQAKAQKEAAKAAAQAQRQAQQQALADARLQTQNARTAAVEQQTINQQKIADAKAAATQIAAATKQQTQQQIADARTAAVQQQTINQQQIAQAKVAATQMAATTRQQTQQQVADARTAAIQQQALNQQQVAQARAAATQMAAVSRQQTQQQIANARVAATQQTAAAQAAATQQTANARAQAIQAQSNARMVQMAMQTVGQTLNNATGMIQSAIGTATGAIQRLGSGIVNGAGAAVSRLAQTFSRAGSAIKGFAASLGSKLTSGLSHFAREGKGAIPIADSVVKKLLSIQTMLVRRLKRTFISFLFKDIQNSINALAKHSSAFNNSMSSMQNAMTQLGANGVVSFGNLINAIAPFITQIVNALSTAITYLNAFFALLSGKSTMTVAKKQTQSFGASAGGAAKQVEKLKNQVYGFDELNKRDSDKDSDSGGGGGGGGAGDLYEDVSVDSVLPEALKAYFEKIKEAFEMKNWEEVGSLIGQGLSYLVKCLDDGILAIHDKAVEYANIAARILNGFVQGFDWALLGKTLGDGFNLAIDVLNMFLTTFDFKALGDALAVGLNSMVETVNWTGLGELIGNLMNGALWLLFGFLNRFNWAGLGDALAECVNTWWDTVNWDLLGKDVALFVNGVMTTLNVFAKNAKWEEWAKDIGTAVKSFFNNTDFTLAGQTLQLWIDGITRMLKTLGEDDEMWTTIRSKIGEFTKALFDEDNIGNAITAVGVFIGKIFLTLGNITKDTPWDVLGRGVAKGLNKLFDTEKATELGDAWGGAIDSVLDGVYEFVTNFEWRGAADAVSSFVNELFDIKWGQLATTILLGLGGIALSISSALKDITEKFPEYASQIAQGVNKVFGSDENGESYIKWDEIGQNFGDSFKNIIQGLATFIQDVDWVQIGTDLVELLKNIKWGDIAEAIWTLFKAALKAAFNLAEGIADALAPSENPYYDVSNANKDAFEGLLGGNYTAMNDKLKQMGGEAASSLYGGFIFGISEHQEPTREQLATSAYLIVNGYAAEIRDHAPEVHAASGEILRSIYDADTVAEMQDAFKQAGFDITDSFAGELTGAGFQNVAAALALLGQGIDQETISALDISHIDSNLKTYMQNSGETITDVAGELAQDAGAAIGRIVPEAAGKSMEEANSVLAESRGKAKDAADLGQDGEALAQSSGEAGAGVPKATGDQIEENISDVEKPVDDLIEAVEKPMEKLTPEQKKNAEMMMQAIDKMISENNPVVEKTMESAAEAVLNKAAEYLNDEKGRELITKFSGGIITRIIQMRPILVRTIKAMATEMHNAVTEIINQTNGEQAAQAYSDGIHAGINTLSDLPEIIKGFTDAIGSVVDASRESILKVVSEMVSGIKSAVQDGGIVSAFSSVAGSAVSAMASQINYSSGQKMGSQLASGLKNGVEGGSGSVDSAVGKVGEQLKDTFKGTVKIGSPSKVFHDYGVYIMQGLVNGIDEMRDDSVDLIGATARAMSEEAKGTEIEMGINATANSLDAVADKLGNIATVFREIATVFETMGNDAIPSVANGTFLPYRTRVEDGLGEGSQVAAATIARATADQTEVIEDQRDLLREILNTMRGLRLSMDVDAVTNAITTRQRTIERNTGTVVV